MKLLLFICTTLFVTVASSSSFASCLLPVRTPFSVVPLFKTDLVGRLENENLLETLCATGDQACQKQALSSYTDEMPVFDAPDGKIIATLSITYTPGKGITANVAQDEKTASFMPPIYDGDWGYGPWFHATLLDQQGSWKKVVLAPFIQGGWIDMPGIDAVELSEPENVYALGERNIVVLSKAEASLTIRDEQPSDMWCAAGDPPTLTPFKEEVLTLNDIYDESCTIRLKPAYTRGC